MFDIALISWLQTFSTPALDIFFRTLTELGSHYAYMAIIPFIYWTIDREVGSRLAGLFLTSMWINGLIKEFLVMPRPDPSLVRVLIDEPRPGFPSGHAQGAITLWGYLALAFQSTWLKVIAILLIILLSVSRLYLGVHYPADVLGGLAIGAALIWIFSRLIRERVSETMSLKTKMLLSVAIPVFAYPLYQTGTSEQLLGFAIGFFTSYLVVGDTVYYKERVSSGQQIAKLVIGYVGFALLIALHMLFLPVGWPGVFGYSLIALWITLGAPMLFQRLGLAGGTRTLVAQAKPAPSRANENAHFRRYISYVWIVFSLVVLSTIYVHLAVPVIEQPAFLVSDRPLAIAHAGGKGVEPENTIRAFQKALEDGADILETDAWMTRDGEVVLIHDATVDRTTDGQGRVVDMTLAEIQSLDAGYRFTTDGGLTYPARGQGVKIPTFREVLHAFPDSVILIEMKQNDLEFPARLLEVIDELDARDRVMVASFHDEPLRLFRSLAPDVATSAARIETTRLVLRQKFGVAAFFPPVAQAVQVPESQSILRVATPGLARLLRRQGVQMHVWTINDPAAMDRLLTIGAQGIITDYITRLNQVIDQMEGRSLDDVFYQ